MFSFKNTRKPYMTLIQYTVYASDRSCVKLPTFNLMLTLCHWSVDMVIFWRPTLLYCIGLHKILQLLMVLCASSSYCLTVFTHHGDKVQQVHPRLVGLGVGQREEGRQLEAHSVACVAALWNKSKIIISRCMRINGDILYTVFLINKSKEKIKTNDELICKYSLFRQSLKIIKGIGWYFKKLFVCTPSMKLEKAAN